MKFKFFYSTVELYCWLISEEIDLVPAPDEILKIDAEVIVIF